MLRDDAFEPPFQKKINAKPCVTWWKPGKISSTGRILLWR